MIPPASSKLFGQGSRGHYLFKPYSAGDHRSLQAKTVALGSTRNSPLTLHVKLSCAKKTAAKVSKSLTKESSSEIGSTSNQSNTHLYCIYLNTPPHNGTPKDLRHCIGEAEEQEVGWQTRRGELLIFSCDWRFNLRRGLLLGETNSQRKLLL